MRTAGDGTAATQRHSNYEDLLLVCCARPSRYWRGWLAPPCDCRCRVTERLWDAHILETTAKSGVRPMVRNLPPSSWPGLSGIGVKIGPPVASASWPGSSLGRTHISYRYCS